MPRTLDTLPAHSQHRYERPSQREIQRVISLRAHTQPFTTPPPSPHTQRERESDALERMLRDLEAMDRELSELQESHPHALRALSERESESERDIEQGSVSVSEREREEEEARECSLREGVKVEANYRGRGRWFPGKIQRDYGDGTFDVQYDDGEHELRVPQNLIRLLHNHKGRRCSNREEPSWSLTQHNLTTQDVLTTHDEKEDAFVMVV